LVYSFPIPQTVGAARLKYPTEVSLSWLS